MSCIEDVESFLAYFCAAPDDSFTPCDVVSIGKYNVSSLGQSFFSSGSPVWMDLMSFWQVGEALVVFLKRA